MHAAGARGLPLILVGDGEAHVSSNSGGFHAWLLVHFFPWIFLRNLEGWPPLGFLANRGLNQGRYYLLGHLKILKYRSPQKFSSIDPLKNTQV